jgi:murein DD-endopeptidase MepM/ murein hydrolase activator NlpD
MRYYDSLGEAGYPISRPCTTMACSYDEHLARGSHGVDYAVKTGTPVIAPAMGRTRNFSNSSAGNAVELHHFDESGNETGFVDTFMHLSAFLPEGVYQPGDTIGISGNTGNSTGPHIHWVAKLNGQFVRQWEYFTEETRKEMHLVNNGAAEFVIGQEYIHHVSGPAEESALIAVLGPVVWKGGADFDNILKGFGIPADKVKFVMGGKTWSRVLETLQAVQAGGGGSTLTVAAIAKGVNDDAAKRMSS